MTNNSTTRVNKIRAALEARNDRSARSKGVTVYAHELLDTIEEAIAGGWFAPDDINSGCLVERCMLNGADTWDQYSWGGCSLIYNDDIAHKLCPPSELKRTKGGQLPPNSREQWLNTQARALWQAAQIVKRIAATI